MFIQIALGSFLVLISTTVGGAGFLLLERTLTRAQPWLMRPPHPRKLMLLLMVAVAWVMLILTVSVWMWALVFWWLKIFITLEASVYFSIVAFTTLGLGDILLPSEWRLLAGMSAVNGLLMIGLLTAILVEVLRRVRAIQAESRDWSV